MRNKLVDLIDNLDRVSEIPTESIPTILVEVASAQSDLAASQARLAAAQNALTARLCTGSQRDTTDRDQLETVTQAARRLSYKPSYVYSLIRQGQLPAVRQGKYVRVRARDVDAWISTRCEKVLGESQYIPYSRRNDGRRDAPDTEETRAYASRVRGPRRPRTQHHSAAGARRDPNKGADIQTREDSGDTV